MVNMDGNQEKQIIVSLQLSQERGKSKDHTALSSYSVYQVLLQILGIVISWGNHIRRTGMLIFNDHWGSCLARHYPESVLSTAFICFSQLTCDVSTIIFSILQVREWRLESHKWRRGAFHGSKVHDCNPNANTSDKARVSQWFQDCARGWREETDRR